MHARVFGSFVRFVQSFARSFVLMRAREPKEQNESNRNERKCARDEARRETRRDDGKSKGAPERFVVVIVIIMLRCVRVCVCVSRSTLPASF